MAFSLSWMGRLWRPGRGAGKSSELTRTRRAPEASDRGYSGTGGDLLSLRLPIRPEGTRRCKAPPRPAGPLRLRRHQALHCTAQSLAESVLLDLEIVAGLEVHPEALRSPEVARQPQRRIRRPRARAVPRVVDANLEAKDEAAFPVLLEDALLVEDLLAADDPAAQHPGLERPGVVFRICPSKTTPGRS